MEQQQQWSSSSSGAAVAAAVEQQQQQPHAGVRAGQTSSRRVRTFRHPGSAASSSTHPLPLLLLPLSVRDWAWPLPPPPPSSCCCCCCGPDSVNATPPTSAAAAGGSSSHLAALPPRPPPHRPPGPWESSPPRWAACCALVAVERRPPPAPLPLLLPPRAAQCHHCECPRNAMPRPPGIILAAQAPGGVGAGRAAGGPWRVPAGLLGHDRGGGGMGQAAAPRAGRDARVHARPRAPQRKRAVLRPPPPPSFSFSLDAAHPPPAVGVCQAGCVLAWAGKVRGGGGRARMSSAAARMSQSW